MHAFVKKDNDLVFQFASLGTVLELINSLDHFYISNSVDSQTLIDFWKSKTVSDINTMWFDSHDNATRLHMSGFKMGTG
jgi:UDP-glucose 4-epimerase